jgi:chromosome segregation ATPase
LTSELEASRKSVEEFRNQRDLLKSDHIELLELRSTKQQLEGEISHLKGELQSAEARVNAAPVDGQAAANDRAKLESVIADLQNQLELHRMREEELAAARQRLADYESHEPIRIDEQKNAQEQLRVLRQELCAAEEKIQELNAAHDHRADLERLYQEAKHEIRQLEEVRSRWQERVAGSDDQRRRAALLRQHLDELQTKQAALIERHRQFQNDLTAAVRLTEVSPDDHGEAPAPRAWQTENEALSFPLAITQADSDALNNRNNGDHEMQADEASATGTDMSPMIPAIDPSSTMITGRRRRRFGIFPA